MKWDRTGEENNSGTGGERVENEMGLERERRTTVALEGREVGIEEMGLERERRTTVALEGRE